NSGTNAVRLNASASSANVAWVINHNAGGNRVTLDNSGTFNFGSLTGSGVFSVTNSGGILSVGALNRTEVFSGAIQGPGSFVKVGTGTMTLTGTNSFTGSTTVNSGSLLLGLNGTVGSTAYTIGDGATFDVSAKSSYSLALIETTINVGATSAGFFNGPTGSLTLGNSLTLNFTTSLLSGGQSYNLFDFGSHTGDFSSVSLTGSIVGSLLLTGTDTWTGIDIGGYDFMFNEATGIFSIAAVPEPSTYAALAGALGLICAGARRRRRPQVV